MTRLERREWDASRSRTESPWIASMRRLRESRWDAARLRRSQIVDRAAGAASGEAAAGEAIGDGEPLVLGFSGESEGERKLRSAAGDGYWWIHKAGARTAPSPPLTRPRDSAHTRLGISGRSSPRCGTLHAWPPPRGSCAQRALPPGAPAAGRLQAVPPPPVTAGGALLS